MRQTPKKKKPVRKAWPVKKRVQFGRPEEGLPPVYIDVDFYSWIHFYPIPRMDIEKGAAALKVILDRYAMPTPISFLFPNQQ